MNDDSAAWLTDSGRYAPSDGRTELRRALSAYRQELRRTRTLLAQLRHVLKRAAAKGDTPRQS
ncbi:MAG TPA: hypothetical protein VNE58_07480 [Casimicrobiaceae bacterium]|nr:hypothetical protein [Casimicrobiaceae bacterium]